MSDLTPAAAIRAFAFSSDPATSAPAPAAPASPTAPSIPVEPYPPQNLNPTYAAQWIEREKENFATGKITQQEFNRRLDSLGATEEQRAPDARTEEQRMLDTHFPAAKPEEFLIHYGEPGRLPPPMTPELQQFDTHVRGWLAGGEFTQIGGNGLVSEIERTVRATKGMTPEQLESYGLVEFAKLEKAYGDTLDEKLHAAALMIDAVDKTQPGLKDLLRSQGIGDSALVANILIGQAQRYWIRRKGR